MRLQKLLLSSCLALFCVIGMSSIVQAAEDDDAVSDPRGSRFHRPVQNAQLDDETSDDTAVHDAPPVLDDGSGEDIEQDTPPLLDDENEEEVTSVAPPVLDEVDTAEDEGMSDGEMAGLVAGSVAGLAVGATAIGLGIKKYRDDKNKGSQYEVVEDDRRSVSDDDSIRLSKNVEEESKKQVQKDKKVLPVRPPRSFPDKQEMVENVLKPKASAAVVEANDEEVQRKKQQALEAAEGEAVYKKLLRNEMRLQDEISETKLKIQDLERSGASAEQLDVEKNLLIRQQRELRQVGERLQAGEQLVEDAEARKAIAAQESERHIALKEKLQNRDVKKDVEGYKSAVQANINVQENIDLQQKRIEQYQNKKKKTQNPVTKIILDKKIKNEQKQLRLKQEGLFKAQQDLQSANETLKARKMSDVDRVILQQEEVRKETVKREAEALKAAQAKKKKASKRLFPNARGIRRAPAASVGVHV